jgi:hypothetical protein
MEYRIVRVSDENLIDFITVFKSVHPESNNLIYFMNKFNTNVLGQKNIGYIAYCLTTTEPVAFYGVFPVLLKSQNNFILAAQSGDTVTHPNYQRKGLFKLLHEETMKLCKELDVKLIFGFPNLNSYPGFIKFGWKDYGKCYNFKCIVRLPFVIKLFRKFSPYFFKKYRKILINNKLIDINKIKYSFSDSIVESYCTNGSFIPRNEVYMKYKLSLESRILNLDSGLVWVKFNNNSIVLGDIFSTNLNRTIRELYNLAYMLGFDVILFSASHQFMFEEFRVALPNYIEEESDPLIINSLGIVNLAVNLFYTSADFDTF